MSIVNLRANWQWYNVSKYITFHWTMSRRGGVSDFQFVALFPNQRTSKRTSRNVWVNSIRVHLRTKPLIYVGGHADQPPRRSESECQKKKGRTLVKHKTSSGDPIIFINRPKSKVDKTADLLRPIHFMVTGSYGAIFSSVCAMSAKHCTQNNTHKHAHVWPHNVVNRGICYQNVCTSVRLSVSLSH